PLLWRPMDEQVNHFEYFVHHEDVRRANGEGPRDLPAEQEAVIWNRMRRSLRMSLRRARGVQVEVVAENGGRAVVGGSGPTVRITGPVGDILLYTFNRKDIAQVELTGDPDAVASLREARLGI
ncbi:MAG TPA: TIGR03085 family protein, partial [Mycobacteriales bacterium]|nr:TIGR03085 family protein [Mycobacteriales bacterium]